MVVSCYADIGSPVGWLVEGPMPVLSGLTRVYLLATPGSAPGKSD